MRQLPFIIEIERGGEKVWKVSGVKALLAKQYNKNMHIYEVVVSMNESEG